MEPSEDSFLIASMFSRQNRTKHLARIFEILEQIPCLAKMVKMKGVAHLEQLILKSTLARFQAQTVVVDIAKDGCISLNILVQGEVDVYGLEPSKKQDKQPRIIGKIVSMAPPFGHVKDYQGRTVTKVVSAGSCSVLSLGKGLMYKLLDGMFVFPQLLDKLEQLKRVLMFQDLDKKSLLRLVECSVKKDYRIYQNVFREGDRPTGLLMLEKGEVRLYKVGKRTLKRQTYIDKIPICILFSRGDLLGAQEVLADSMYSYNAQCSSSQSTIVQFPRDAIVKILGNTSVDLKQISARSQTRKQRIETVQKINQKQIKKQESVRKAKRKLSFQQKDRIYNSGPETWSQQSIYLSNRPNQKKLFQTEEQFYKFKIKRFSDFAKSKYGNDHGCRFVSLFKDFETPRKVAKDLLFRKSVMALSSINISRQSPRKTSGSFNRLKTKSIESDPHDIMISKALKTCF